jgi:hypothetical protein
MGNNAKVTVYTMNGVQVAEGRGMGVLNMLNKGLYVVKVSDGQQVKTMRIARNK